MMYDFQKMNENVEQFLTDSSKSKLIKCLKHARDVYYNNPTGVILKDDVYDRIEDYVKNKYNYELKEVGASVTKNKVKLPIYMPSIMKIKTEKKIEQWSSEYDTFVMSDKLDGMSLLVFKDSQSCSTKACTRGNGTIGRDISWVCKYIKIGALSKDEYVRGELIISKSKWNKIRKKFPQYTNSRNFVSGVTNQKNANYELLSSLDFIAFEYIHKNKNYSFSEQFIILKKKKFNVVYSLKMNKSNIKFVYLSDLLQERRNKSRYEIDGIIISSDKAYKRVSESKIYPEYSKAFKQNVDFVETTVTDVSWNPSMYGVLKPLVHIKKVVIDNSNIQNVTGHNAKYIFTNCIGKGAVVRITKSGGVIPSITSVMKSSYVEQLGPCTKKYKWKWNDTKVDIELQNPLSNKLVAIKRLTHLLEKLKVNAIKIGIMTKLYNHNINTAFKLLSLTKDDVLKLKIQGVGTKLALKIESELSKIPKQITMPDLMSGSLCFGFGMSDKKIFKMCEAIPDILNENEINIRKILSETKGFSNKTIDKCVTGLYKFKQFILSIPVHMRPPQIQSNKQNKKMKNITKYYLFSGCRPTDVQKQKCLENGVDIISSFSKK